MQGNNRKNGMNGENNRNIRRAPDVQGQRQGQRMNSVNNQNRVQQGNVNRIANQQRNGQMNRTGKGNANESLRRYSYPDARKYPMKKRKKKKGFQPIDALIAILAVLIVVVIIMLIVQSKNNRNNGKPETTVNVAKTSEIQTLQTEKTPESESEKKEEKDVPPSFTADLSAYEEYMNPQGEKRDAFLILVSPGSPLGADYIPEDLVDVVNTRKDGRATQKMRLYAEKALEALYIDADANGMLNNSTGRQLSVTSAYRSYATQNSNFNNYVNQEMAANKSLTKEQATEIVAKYCNPPGKSEHQTGLCCDMHNQAAADSDHPDVFANTKEGQWLVENCWKYGFVLRYPEDKMNVTKITYESWHFRYVGRYHAKRMTELNMCLEEYVEYLSK